MLDAVNKAFKDPLKNNPLNGRFAELMNREWVLGAGSIISSDRIIGGYKVPCILDDLDGSLEDELWKAVSDESTVALPVTKIPMPKMSVKSKYNCCRHERGIGKREFFRMCFFFV